MLNDTLCKQCWPEGEIIIQITDQLYLLKYTTPSGDSYSIIQEPCHKDDILFSYSCAPYIEPEEDYEWEEWFDFCDIDYKTNPELGWYLIENLKTIGYNPDEDGMLTAWLFGKIGEMIRDKEQVNK